MSKRVAIGLCTLGLVACDRGDEITTTDASTDPPISASETHARAVLASLDAIEPFAGHLGRGVALRRESDGFHSMANASLLATAPVFADGVLRLGLPHHNAAMTITALGARPVAGTRIDGAIVYRDAFIDTDLVEVLDLERVEEIRILRSPAAPNEARYRVDLGSKGEIALVDGRLIARDDDGLEVLESAPLFAVDAKGERRAVSVRIERALDAFVVVARLECAGLQYPIAVDPIWKSVGSTPARYYHSAALIGGKVLAAGGVDTGSSPIASAVYFDGTSVTAAPPLPTKRQSFTLSPLGATKLLAAGGFSGTVAMSNVDVFDGSAWASASAMANARYAHTASVLSTGVVLVAGGYGTSAPVAVSEQFNGSVWSSAGSLVVARYNHAAVVFKAAGLDRVLVVGGNDGSGAPLASAEVWNGTSWSPVTSMGSARANHTATLLASGRILITGGRGAASTYLDSGEVYDPVANAWSPVSNKLTGPRAEHGALLLAGDTKGRVIIAGGYTTGGAIVGTTDYYDPATNAFAAGPAMNSARTRFSLTAMTPAAGEAARIAAIGGISGTGTYATVVDLLSPLADGASCAIASDCLAPYCTVGRCCNAASCSAGYTCASGVCATSCASAGVSASCAAGYYCTGSVCVANKPNGSTCGAAYECISGFCVDAVCCNAACAGQCEACDATGVCNPTLGAPKGTRPACIGTALGTTCGIKCNGIDRAACQYPDSTVSCGIASCLDGTTGGVETDPGKCDSAGGCGAVTKSCGAYKCGPTACKLSCSTDGDCEGGYHCDTATSKCIPDLERGKDCKTTAECGKLTCVDMKCCGAASCGPGETCAYVGKEGSCIKKEGTACTADVDCGSAYCADGVCCTARCDGQCEACDVSGSVGTCSPVKGVPHGIRAKCDGGGGDDCKVRQCDGLAANTTTCAGYVNGTEKECKGATCAAGDWTAPSHCDGKGVCKTPAASSCKPWGCDVSGCKATCANNEDCSPGSICKGGRCQGGAFCSDDHTVSSTTGDPPHDCTPFTCSNGTCVKPCTNNAECVAGFQCSSSGECLGSTSPPPPSCGCFVVGRVALGDGTDGAAGLASVSAIAMAIRRRPRRPRRAT